MVYAYVVCRAICVHLLFSDFGILVTVKLLTMQDVFKVFDVKILYGFSVDPPKPEEAIKLFHLAASAGHVRSQYNLALCLQQGRGVQCNLSRAVCPQLAHFLMNVRNESIFLLCMCVFFFIIYEVEDVIHFPLSIDVLWLLSFYMNVFNSS